MKEIKTYKAEPMWYTVYMNNSKGGVPLENYAKLKTEEVETISDIQHYLYKTYYKDVFRTIYYIINDRDISQDLVNESFIKAFNKLHTLRETDKFKPWICAIASNVAKNHIRKEKRIVSYDSLETVIESYENLEDTILDAINEKELKAKIKVALDSLDEDSKQVIVLRYFHDFSYESVSKHLNIKEGTVKSKISRAKRKLYQLLKIEGEDNA